MSVPVVGRLLVKGHAGLSRKEELLSGPISVPLLLAPEGVDSLVLHGVVSG